MFSKFCHGGDRRREQPWSDAEFVGAPTFFTDARTDERYILEPGYVCMVRVTSVGDALWLEIRTPSGRRGRCPYASLDALVANWRVLHRE